MKRLDPELPFYYFTSSHSRFYEGEMPEFSEPAPKPCRPRRAPRRELLGSNARVTYAVCGNSQYAPPSTTYQLISPLHIVLQPTSFMNIHISTLIDSIYTNTFHVKSSIHVQSIFQVKLSVHVQSSTEKQLSCDE